MLIRNANVWLHGPADVRIADGIVAEIAPPQTLSGDRWIDATGKLLLPGLHDHHIHLAALAARAGSVCCGPPEVCSAQELASALQSCTGDGWLRGIGYHESVMGLPDARALDRMLPDRPLRIQHRSGRMWLFNSPALAHLLDSAPPPPGLERDATGFTGRLFDEDAWLQRTLASVPPDFADISRALASQGITGVTDMSPRNDPAMAAHFSEQIKRGSLLQRCRLAGSLELIEAPAGPWQLGEAKLHLHEAALPHPDDAVGFVARAHDQGRSVAVHCVTEVELVYALAVFEQVRTRPGDRIEHASIASLDLVERMAEIGLKVCVQPHFLNERGDAYLVDVELRHIPDLYRLRSLRDAGLILAGGSDAPFGSSDPWRAIGAATSRRTTGGKYVGSAEALTPEQAVELYLAEPGDLSRRRRITVGAAADLCLLNRAWDGSVEDLHVGMTMISGEVIHDAIHETPD